VPKVELTSCHGPMATVLAFWDFGAVCKCRDSLTYLLNVLEAKKLTLSVSRKPCGIDR